MSIGNFAGGYENTFGAQALDILKSGANSLFKSSGFVSTTSYAEDFNRLRQINHLLVHTDFVQEWNYRLEIEGAPAAADFFIKDVSFSIFEMKSDEEMYGGAAYTHLTGDQLIKISFTARDSFDSLLTNFLFKWRSQCSNGDGTVNLPLGINGYVKLAKIYNINTQGKETLYYCSHVFPLQAGDITRSRENGQFMEIPVTLAQFSTNM